MLLGILRFVFIILEVLLIFNIIIVVHELGHFLAARWRGLVVEGFGVWFGKPIWQKTINGVRYSLGSIPAGGFVKLPQLAPMEAMEGKSEHDAGSLPPVSALDKIIVAFAGPLFSFGLAALFATIIWLIGRPVSESEATRTVGYVLPNSPADQAGIRAGDEILEVDGLPVTRFGGMGGDSITWRIVRSEGETIPITLRRGDEVLTVHPKPLRPEGSMWQRKSLRQIQILPAETPMVAKVLPGSAAEKAGIQSNDLLLEVNGQRLLNAMGIDEYVKAHPEEPITLTVKRGDATLKLPFHSRGAIIAEIMKNSPAEAAGLKKNDVITAVDGTPVANQLWLTDYIRQRPGGPLRFAVQRDAESFEVTVTPVIPASGATNPMIGVSWGDLDGIIWDAMGPFTIRHPNPAEQIYGGVMAIVNTIDAVASPKSDVKLQQMNGPVAIMRVYYLMFESKEGWRLALWFSVIFNVNLALLNMLPIPVLDGGHITLALIEAARRKPVNIRVLEAVQSACAILIIGFMIYIAFFDVQDLFGSRRSVRDEIKFAAPAATQTR